MGTAFNPAKTSPTSWDAFSDVEAFVDAVLAELAADGARSTRTGPKPPLAGAALRKAGVLLSSLGQNLRRLRTLPLTAGHAVRRRSNTG